MVALNLGAQSIKLYVCADLFIAGIKLQSNHAFGLPTVYQSRVAQLLQDFITCSTLVSIFHGHFFPVRGRIKGKTGPYGS